MSIERWRSVISDWIELILPELQCNLASVALICSVHYSTTSETHYALFVVSKAALRSGLLMLVRLKLENKVGFPLG